MKIGFDAKRAFSNYTGLGNYSRSTLRVLTQEFPKNEFFLYTPRVPDEDQVAFLELPKHANFHVKIPLSFFYESFPSVWRSIGLTGDLLRDGVEVYHGLSHELPRGIVKTSIRSIVTIHDLIFKRFPHYYKAADRNIYDRKFKHACEVSDSIIAISEQSKRDIIHFYHIEPEKISVVYQSCSPIFNLRMSDEQLERIRLKYQLPSQFLLSVGTIEARKNTGLIIQAIGKAALDIPLVLVGRTTPYGEELKRYVSSKGIKNIHFLHEVSFDDLPGIYQLSNVFIYPSQFEGFGIPIIEALSSGVPVIAAKGSCLEEAGGPQSHYVRSDSIDDMVEAIQLLLSGSHEQLIQDGFKYVERFSAKIVAQELMDVYENKKGR